MSIILFSCVSDILYRCKIAEPPLLQMCSDATVGRDCMKHTICDKFQESRPVGLAWSLSALETQALLKQRAHHEAINCCHIDSHHRDPASLHNIRSSDAIVGFRMEWITNYAYRSYGELLILTYYAETCSQTQLTMRSRSRCFQTSWSLCKSNISFLPWHNCWWHQASEISFIRWHDRDSP